MNRIFLESTTWNTENYYNIYETFHLIVHLFLCASIATHARFFMLGFFIQLGSTSDAIKQTRLKVCRHSWFYCHTERPSVNISFIFYILKRARVVFTRYYLWNNFFLFLCLGPSSNNVLGKILFENITTTRYK